MLDSFVVARCVTVPRCASSNASRSDEMRYSCASPSCEELTSSIKFIWCLTNVARINFFAANFSRREMLAQGKRHAKHHAMFSIMHYALGDLVMNRVVAQCVTVPCRASNNASRNL